MLPNKNGNILPIIEYVFHYIAHFSFQIVSFIHAFVLNTNGLKVDADYIIELGFFLPRLWEQKGLCTTAANRPFTVIQIDA